MRSKYVGFVGCCLTLVAITANAQNTFPATGNVGIGTTTPAALLSVGSGLQVNGNGQATVATGAGGAMFTGHEVGGTYTNALGIYRAITDNPAGINNYFYQGITNGTMNFSVRADGLAYFAGSVGIGVTAPQAKLHVFDTAKLYNSVGNEYDSNVEIQGNYSSKVIGQGPSLGFISPANTDGSNPWEMARILSSPDNANTADANGRMYLQTRYANAGSWYWNNNLVLTSNGNVGIGTTAPTYPLQIGNSTSGCGNELGVFNSANYAVLTVQGSSPCVSTWPATSAAIESNQGGLVLDANGSNPILFQSNRVTAMTVASGGNLGIGTTTPAYKLDVAGPIRSSSGGIVFPDGSTQSTASATVVSGNNVITQSSGNVGIGTTNPAQKLSVSQGSLDFDNYGFISSYRGPSNSYTNLFLGGSIVDNGNGTYTVQTDGGSNNFAAIRMDNSGGNAGAINFYSAPAISGSTYSLTNAQLASYQKMTIVGGNVGIGTASPGAKLEVSGNVKLTAGSGASITFADGTVQSTAYTGISCGGDYAESVDVAGDRTNYEPGDVLVIGAESGSDVLKSSEPYSTLVAGIYSTKPGIVGRRQTTNAGTSTTEVPMAMVGIVPTKVSAENGPIKRGDLLVTSSILGYAMKGTDRSQMLGAVIGKAMGNLDAGTGVIEVLVTLQ